jgi:hypothetical protein
MPTLLDQTQFSLCCFILGDGASHLRAFSIAISPAATIDAFRQMIRQRNERDFNIAEIDDRELTLWKVSIPLTEIAAKLGDVRDLEAIDGIRQLGPGQTISEAFEDPPLVGHLHVIVQTPVSSESQYIFPTLCSVPHHRNAQRSAIEFW